PASTEPPGGTRKLSRNGRTSNNSCRDGKETLWTGRNRQPPATSARFINTPPAQNNSNFRKTWTPQGILCSGGPCSLWGSTNAPPMPLRPDWRLRKGTLRLYIG